MECSTCALYACLGLGVGGNLPVDAAVFLECLPPNSSSILTGLATWWSVGTLIARFVTLIGLFLLSQN